MGRAARANLNVLGQLRLVLDVDQRQVESELGWGKSKLSRLEHQRGPRYSGYRQDIETVLNHYELRPEEDGVIYNMVLMLMGLAHVLQAPADIIHEAAAMARQCDLSAPAKPVIHPRGYRPNPSDQQKIVRQLLKHLLRDHPIWREVVD